MDEEKYALGHSPAELKRLSMQAKLLEPFTRTIFEQAGIGAGMKVLDAGSGPGDVAFLARELVGVEGHVTGTDRSAEALTTARSRAAELGYTNVDFVQSDPAGMSANEIGSGRPFDAVVGRFILMYYSEPAHALRNFMRWLRPGGIAAFQEVCHAGIRSYPRLEIVERLFELTGKAQRICGAEPDMGLKLYSTFISAGLPPPKQQANMGIMGSQDPNAEGLTRFITQSLRSMMPVIIQHGISTAEEIEIDTYAQRMLDEFRVGGGVLLSPPFIGAWSNKPE